MTNRRDIVANVMSGAIMTGLALFAATFPAAPISSPAAKSGGLTIPSVDQMCRALGATDGDALKQCLVDENDAGEFVIAWMGYNNFIVDGAISLDQIQLLSSLDDNALGAGFGADPALGYDPALGGLDPSADPSLLGGDPSLSGDPTLSIDPITGEPLTGSQSPAQIALVCLMMATDWISLQQCISDNDPSSSISGTP